MNWGITCFFENRKDFEMVAEMAPDYPLKYLEIRGERPFFSPEDLTAPDLQFFRDVIHRSGLRVTVHSTFYDVNLATINSYLRRANMDCYKKYLDLCQEIGAEIMAVHAGMLHRDAAGIPRLMEIASQNLVENLQELGEYGERRGVKIALENSPPNPNWLMVSNWESQIAMLQKVNHANVGALFDTAHAFLQGLDISPYFNEIRDYLFEIHTHNNNGKQDLHWGMKNGAIDYLPFFRANKIEVPIIMEIHNLQEAVESLEWIRQFEEDG